MVRLRGADKEETTDKNLYNYRKEVGCSAVGGDGTGTETGRLRQPLATEMQAVQ